jgi:hypothetical protein
MKVPGLSIINKISFKEMIFQSRRDVMIVANHPHHPKPRRGDMITNYPIKV